VSPWHEQFVAAFLFHQLESKPDQTPPNLEEFERGTRILRVIHRRDARATSAKVPVTTTAVMTLLLIFNPASWSRYSTLPEATPVFETIPINPKLPLPLADQNCFFTNRMIG
jgi:hypothetical protein